MITLKPELDDVEKLIWKVRAHIGREEFKAAEELMLAPAKACDFMAKVSNHLPLEELKRLKELSDQCFEILVYLDDRTP